MFAYMVLYVWIKDYIKLKEETWKVTKQVYHSHILWSINTEEYLGFCNTVLKIKNDSKLVWCSVQ